jgi:hypothetical protein
VRPGLRRVGPDRYVDADAEPVTDEETLARIRGLSA